MTTAARLSPPTALTFLGAAGTVTGSKYLLSVGDDRVLVDAGMFQGEKEWRLRNWEEFPIDPAQIRAIILTHAHADHCTYLPALVARGFDGPIWLTQGTASLARIVLRDAGKLQELASEDAIRGGYSKHNPPLPLFTLADVERTLPMFRVVEFEKDVDLGQGIVGRWTRAGHILGSASVRVAVGDTSVLFSGDLGRHDHPILRPRDTPRGADYVLCESTYGDREHPEIEGPEHEDFAAAIRRTIARGGTVVVPAFAVDRTETVLRALTLMMREGRIPDVPVIVDSPMALAALDVYSNATLGELREDIDVKDFTGIPQLRTARSSGESKALNHNRKPSIIISSSGMAEGGRVLHHLSRLLPDERNCVVLVGFQAPGTRGRQLEDGARQVKIHGHYVKVRAEIVRDREFSVHGDASDLLDWLRELEPQPETVFVIHGEAAVSQLFADRIEAELGVMAVVPGYAEVVALSAPPPVVGEDPTEVPTSD